MTRKDKGTGLAWYENTEHGFRMKYPKSWERLDKLPQALVAFVKPGKKILRKAFNESVNVVFRDMKGQGADLASFVDMAMMELDSMVPGFELLADESCELAGKPARMLSYSGDYKKGQRLRWLQYITTARGDVYALTFIATEDKYDEALMTVREMIDSFAWSVEPPASEE